MGKKFQPIGICMIESRSRLGNFVRQCRLGLGVSQTLLAEITSIPQSLISLIEVGGQVSLKDRQIRVLSTALQCEQTEIRKFLPPVARPKTELAKLIKTKREELGMDFEDFAKKMGRYPAHARYFEHDISVIELGLMRKLVKVLKLNPNDLARFVRGGNPDCQLGTLVRSRRLALGLSAKQLGKRVGVVPQAVSLVEIGKTTLCNSDGTLEKYAVALQLDLNQLHAARQLSAREERRRRLLCR